MTTAEFDSEFTLGYDAGTAGAPDIDQYERSVYLTTAQEQIAKAYYSGHEKTRTGFEGSEKRRRTMSELVKSYSQTTHSTSSRGMVKDSIFFAIPTNVFYIVSENVTLESTKDACINGTKALVRPVTNDEFWADYRNPFRKPNKNKAWRLDISKDGSNPVVEIVASHDVSRYEMRYVKAPEPIILTDLTVGEFEGMGLSINGQTAPQTCQLNEEIHREILNRAVELAVRDYREPSLKSKIETNNRV